MSIECSPQGEVTHKNLYVFDTTDTPNAINAKTKASGSIRIRLTSVTTEEIREGFECRLNINAIERTSIAEAGYKEEILNGQVRY